MEVRSFSLLSTITVTATICTHKNGYLILIMHPYFGLHMCLRIPLTSFQPIFDVIMYYVQCHRCDHRYLKIKLYCITICLFLCFLFQVFKQFRKMFQHFIYVFFSFFFFRLRQCVPVAFIIYENGVFLYQTPVSTHY